MTDALEQNTPGAGAQARSRIIDTALDMFGNYGYDGVSVRRLCEGAGVNVGAVTYHFGGKEGLYKAVADHIATLIRQHMWPVAAQIAQFVQEADDDAEKALDLITELQCVMVDLLVPDSSATERWARFIVRFQLDAGSPDSNLGHNDVQHMCAHLVGVIRRRPADKLGNRILAQTLFGQILIFRTNRRSVLDLLGKPALSPSDTRAVKAMVVDNTRKIFAAEVPYAAE